MPRILVLGMSHVVALAASLTGAERAFVEVVNLREAPDIYVAKTGRLDLGARRWDRPSTVCLLIDGNLHNVLALLENPTAFRLGDAALGAVPADPSRHFVPRDMMRAFLEARLERVARLTRTAHGFFPEARFVHLGAPPPVRALRPADPAAAADPQEEMSRFLAFDAAPPELRRRIHEVQQEVYARLAAELGALFLGPPEAALTADGLLDDAYWDRDPTHGNRAYGRLVMDRILSLAMREAA